MKMFYKWLFILIVPLLVSCTDYEYQIASMSERIDELESENEELKDQLIEINYNLDDVKSDIEDDYLDDAIDKIDEIQEELPIR